MHMKKIIFLSLCLLTLVSSCGTREVPTGVFERSVVIGARDGKTPFYRIPAVATAADGSIIAIADRRNNNLNDLPGNIDVFCRRSEDNGRTWSEPVIIAGADTETGFGDVAIVLNRRNNELVCLITSGNGLWQSNADHSIRLFTSRSKDNGKSWSTPVDITPQIFGKECGDSIRSRWYGAFISSGSALQTESGRIMAVIPTRTVEKWGGPLSTYVIYSDDNGDTWQVSETPGDTDGDESKLVELENGDILMSIRNRHQSFRKFSVSHDKGGTWSAPHYQEDIIDPACNGDILRYTAPGEKGGYLLHSIPYHPKSRENVSILASFDEGKSWKQRRTLCEGASAYSSLTVLKDGTIGCLVEEGDYSKGFEIVFYRFSPDWLLNDPTGKG